MQVYLPKGKVWYDYWTGKKYAGGHKYRLKLSPDSIPIFMCGGSVLPQVDTPCQATVDTLAAKQLSLRLYLGEAGSGQLYWDKGEGYGYEQEEYLMADYSFTYEKSRLTLQQTQKGKYRASFKTILLHIQGAEDQFEPATVDGKSIEAQEDGTYVLPFGFKEFRC